MQRRRAVRGLLLRALEQSLRLSAWARTARGGAAGRILEPFARHAGYATRFKEDLRAIDEAGRGGGSPALVPAMREWADHTWRKLRGFNVSLRAGNRSAPAVPFEEKLRRVMADMRSFGEAALPSRVRKLPVFYLFAGADVITARGFFPHAPRVLLTSGLPFGDVPPPLLRPNPAALAARCTRPRPSRRARAQVGCFLHAPCATSMRRAALAALDNWQ